MKGSKIGNMNQKKINNINNDDDISMYYPDGDAANMSRDDHDEFFLAQNSRKKAQIKKKNARLTKSQITLIAVIFVIYVVILIVAAFIIFYKPQTPGNEELPFDTNPIEGYDKPPLDNQQGSDASDNAGEYNPVDGIYNFLVVGSDRAASLADVTMIINCNTVDKTISVMQIPRDTLVTIEVETNKINAAYSLYYNKSYGESDRIAATMQKYTELLEKSLCINIHHTVAVNLDGFQNIINILGGVDIYVPDDMFYEDPIQNLVINLPKGYQHLDGYQSECFVRFRSGFLQADLGRANAQKIFMTALFNKVKATVKEADVSVLTKLAGEIFKNVHTDLSVANIVYYAKFLLEVDLSSINMMTMPGNVESYGVHYVMNRAATLEIINKYFNIYQKEITDSIFDRNYTFCFVDKQRMVDIYFASADSAFGDVYNADDIDKDSIDIPSVSD